jgi:hypothetical protein
MSAFDPVDGSIVLDVAQPLVRRMAELPVVRPCPEFDFRDQSRLAPDDVLPAALVIDRHLLRCQLVEKAAQLLGVAFTESDSDRSDVDEAWPLQAARRRLPIPPRADADRS